MKKPAKLRYRSSTRNTKLVIPKRSKHMDTEQYVAAVGRLNLHVPTEFLINGRKVTL